MIDLSSFSFIFIGETHGFVNDFEKEQEIINKANPEFVLSEQMQEIILDTEENYLSLIKKQKISELVSFEEVKNLVLLCQKNRIKLIGMDFTNFGFNKEVNPVIKGQKSPTKFQEKQIEDILKKREIKHLETINNYNPKTKKPIVILLGSWYLKEDSLLMTSLNNYIAYFPRDAEGNQLIGSPGAAKSIKYSHRIKK